MKAVAEGDQKFLAQLLDDMPGLARGMAEAYAGITVEAFERAVRSFFDSARNPAFGVPYARLGYRPMHELIELLMGAEFEVYICSPGGRDFIRVVAQEMYGVDRQHVIGSGATLAWRLTSAVWPDRDRGACPACRREVTRPPHDDLRVPTTELEDTGGGRGVQYGVA